MATSGLWVGTESGVWLVLELGSGDGSGDGSGLIGLITVRVTEAELSLAGSIIALDWVTFTVLVIF